MKVFLTGATGYIGSVVGEVLKKARYSVIGLVRSDEKAKQLEHHGIVPYKGDLLDPDAIAKKAMECDGVIHVASTNDANAGRVDAALATSLIQKLENRNKFFIYTSGIWVMGETHDYIADEAFSLNPTPLVAWRVDVEKQVIESAKKGIRAVVIRPALVYGRGGGLPRMMVDSAREYGAARYVGNGENRWTFVHVEDVADLYIRVIKKAIAGSLFIAAHGPSVRVKEVAQAASYGAGAQGKIESWPLETARKKLGLLADALVLDQQISGEKAKSLIGWSPKFQHVLEDLKQGSYTIPT